MITLETLKQKASEYPIAFASLAAACVSVAVLYVRSDVEAELLSRRDAAVNALNAMRENDRNSARLADDVRQSEELRTKVEALALDFTSTVAVQAFLADFTQASTIKLAGAPRQQAQHLDLPSKPLAVGSYSVDGEVGFLDALRYVSLIEANANRSITVTRVQIGSSDRMVDASPADASPASQTFSIAFRLWGRKGEYVRGAVVPDKAVSAIASRKARLAAGVAAMTPSPLDYSTVFDLFSAASPQGAASAAGRDGSVETDDVLLKNLAFSITPFRGELIVKIDGIGARRVNSEFEISTRGRIAKFRIASIEGDAFFVVTSTGNRIKVSKKK